MNSSIFVSVICSEKAGGGGCSACLELDESLNCGWCNAVKSGCTLKSQCENGDWVSRGHSSSCPYDTVVGVFVLLTLLLATVIIIVVIVFIIILVDKIARLWRGGKSASSLDLEQGENGLRRKNCLQPHSVSSISMPLPSSSSPGVVNNNNNNPDTRPAAPRRTRPPSRPPPPIPVYAVVNKRGSSMTTDNSIYGKIISAAAKSFTSQNSAGSRISCDLVISAEKSMTSTSTSSEHTTDSATTTETTATFATVKRRTTFNDHHQYLAEAPFSCQTSLVPVTRNQFYLVVQINMNENLSPAFPAFAIDDKDRGRKSKSEEEPEGNKMTIPEAAAEEDDFPGE